MAVQLMGSVGRGGRNQAADVQAVQKLLTGLKLDTGGIDGVCGLRTVHAIVRFQRGFLQAPDGRIDPGGTTWQRLLVAKPGAAGVPAFDDLVAVPPRGTINVGLTAVNNAYMLGKPRDTFTAADQPVTDTRLKRNVVFASVGPFRVNGLRPAVHSLAAVLAEVQRQQPALHAVLGTGGMLVCRLQRNSAKAISNHSWGTAVDLKINATLDIRGDGRVQYGLTLLAPIFNAAGWYWGATFPTEDGMHFEASRQLIDQWTGQLL